MFSPIEIFSMITIVPALGVAMGFYFKSRRLLSANKALLTQSRDALQKQTEAVLAAVNRLSGVVESFEAALKIASKSAFKEAISESILVVRNASAVEVKNGSLK